MERRWTDMEELDLDPRLGPLVLYTRRFAALIDAGVSLMRCFELLQDATGDPAIAAANAELSKKVGDGMQMSAAMAERPELFPAFYIAFVRAGEIGGVLDEALAYLAAWLEQERAAAERLRTNMLLAQLTARVTDGAAASGIGRRVAEALREARRVARVASFCRLFEMCLTAGVPMKLALATAADILPEPGAKRVREGAEALGTDAPIAPILAEVAELRTVVSPMVATGEEHACLDHMLRKAAEFYDAEAADVLHSAARLPAEA